MRRQRCTENEMGAALGIRYRLLRCFSGPPLLLLDDDTEFSTMGHRFNRSLKYLTEAIVDSSEFALVARHGARRRVVTRPANCGKIALVCRGTFVAAERKSL